MSTHLFLFPGAEKCGGEERMRRCARLFCCQKEEKAFCRIFRTRKGKPFFPDIPEIFCSISHTPGYWACAVSHAPVGLDVEKIRPRPYGAIARRFFHPKEAEYAAGGPEAFFSVWTAKESYVKLLGRGIDAEFSSFSVVDEGALLERLGEIEFRQIPLEVGYCMSLCGTELGEVRQTVFPSEAGA